MPDAMEKFWSKIEERVSGILGLGSGTKEPHFCGPARSGGRGSGNFQCRPPALL